MDKTLSSILRRARGVGAARRAESAAAATPEQPSGGQPAAWAPLPVEEEAPIWSGLHIGSAEEAKSAPAADAVAAPQEPAAEADVWAGAGETGAGETGAGETGAGQAGAREVLAVETRAGGVSRQDVVQAFRLLLRRWPENDQVVEDHLGFPDLESLAATIRSSGEYSARQGGSVAAAPATPEAQIYTGYRPEELAVFGHFPAVAAEPTEGMVTNFLGTRIRTSFFHDFAPYAGLVEGVPGPAGSVQGNIPKWLGCLRAVLGASEQFRMLELGAGFGPWMSTTYAAARARGLTDIRVYGVEAEPGHYRFMPQHMGDNALPPEVCVQIHATVGVEPGSARWGVLADPASSYSSQPLGPDLHDFDGRVPAEIADVGQRAISELLQQEELWDLVVMDVPGIEAALCRAGAAALGQRVRRVVVSTHGRVQDGAVMAQFQAEGWVLENEKPSRQQWHDTTPRQNATVSEAGVQVWRNPQLAGPVD